MDAQTEQQQELTHALLAEIAIRDACPMDALVALASALAFCIQSASVSKEKRPIITLMVLTAVHRALAETPEA